MDQYSHVRPNFKTSTLRDLHSQIQLGAVSDYHERNAEL